MTGYTVRQLADLAGVSVRTLHHYDQIGLLVPAARSAAGYRLYQHDDLLRLQQVLFYRELDVPLREIGRILDDPAFDPQAALREHRDRLHARVERLSDLLRTIDKTLTNLEDNTMPLKDEELYKGFDKATAERYRREARENWGEETVEATEQRVKKMGKAQWKAVQAEGEAVTQAIAALMDHAPDDDAVQALMARHHAWIEHFYPCPAEMYKGLGQMYVEHAEFRAFYEQRAEGLAAFMCAAMEEYADRALSQ